jgi:transaldolase
MDIFLDSADINLITKYNELGIIDGVTTNPTIIASTGMGFSEVIKKICSIVKGPVSAEVISLDRDNMFKEGKHLAKIASNVVVKLPVTIEGLAACYRLSQEGISVNMTLCFSASQALLAAKSGAQYISPFIGRLDDISSDGVQLISDIRNIFDNYPNLDTKILAASIRNVQHILEVSTIGADVATIPPKLIDAMIAHPLTDKGIEIFNRDWLSTSQELRALDSHIGTGIK